MSELLVKALIGVLAGIVAFKWGAMVEIRNLSTRARIISFGLLLVFATGIGMYLFYVH